MVKLSLSFREHFVRKWVELTYYVFGYSNLFFKNNNLENLANLRFGFYFLNKKVNKVLKWKGC